MGKLQKNESGFSVVEVVLVIVVVALIGVVGYMVYHNHHKTTTAAITTTSATKPVTSTKATTATPAKTVSPYAGWNTYTSADGTYTISYPTNWGSDSCSTNNTCSTTAEVDNYVSPTTNPGWQVVALSHNKTTLSAQAWFNQSENAPSADDCLYGTSSASINGYQAYFTELYRPLDISNPSCPSSPPPVGAYSYQGQGNVGYEDYYVVSHNGVEVTISMPVQNGDNGTRNTAPLVSTFNQIANSISFHN